MPKKGSKPAATKVIAKKPKAIKKPKEPEITQAQFEKYFFSLSNKKFVQLTKDWNEEKLKVKLVMQPNYDAWLNYFKTMSPNTIRLLAETGLDILPTEGYAALSRWHDIISNPGRIDKIHRAGLSTGEESKTIAELAKANDRYGVLKATRDKIAQKLDQGAGNRDTTDLSKQIVEIMTQIADYERRLAPDKKTKLGELLSDMPKGGVRDKRPSRNGGGSRNTSFASRVTIKDIEGK